MAIEFPRHPVPSAVNVPVPDYSGQAEMWGMVARTGNRLTYDLAQLAATRADLENRLIREEAKLDVEKNVQRLSQDVDAMANDLQQQGVPLDQLESRLAEQTRLLAQQYQSRLKYPQYGELFQVHAEKVLGPQFSKIRHAARAASMASTVVQWEELNRRDATLAVSAETPELAARWKASGENRILSGVAAGYYSEAEGVSRMRQFRSSIEAGEIRRDFGNPLLKYQVVEKLEATQYTWMPPDQQLKMAETYRKQIDSDAKKRDEATEKAFKDQQTKVVSDLWSMASQGTLTPEVLERNRVDWTLDGHQTKFIRDEMIADRSAKERPSDPDVRDLVFADVLSTRPRISEEKLKEYRAAHRRGDPGLDAKDFERAMSHRTSTLEQLRTQGRTEAMASHQQAEQEGGALLGIPQFGEIMDPVRKQLWPLFLGELRRRSNAYGGKEDPLKVLEEIGPRYSGAVGSDNRASADKLRGMLAVQGTSAGMPLNTGPQIEAAWKAGRINRGQYDNARKLLMEIEAKDALIQQDQERLKAFQGRGSGVVK